jgi:hypothetical protein
MGDFFAQIVLQREPWLILRPQSGILILVATNYKNLVAKLKF